MDDKMKEMCIAKTRDGRCKNKALYEVSKRDDFSHRTAVYCKDHVVPYHFYSDDFKIKELIR